MTDEDSPCKNEVIDQIEKDEAASMDLLSNPVSQWILKGLVGALLAAIMEMVDIPFIWICIIIVTVLLVWAWWNHKADEG